MNQQLALFDIPKQVPQTKFTPQEFRETYRGWEGRFEIYGTRRIGKASLYQVRCDIYNPAGKWTEIIEAETKTTKSIRSQFRETVDRLAAATELPVISAIAKTQSECAPVKPLANKGDWVKLHAAWMDKCAADITTKRIKQDYQYKTEQDLICQVTWASEKYRLIAVARNGNAVFVPAGFFDLVEAETGNADLDRWNPALFGEVPRKIDDGGQVSVFWDDSEEPPDPDDYLNLEDYHQAWGIWAGRFPELASSVLDHPPSPTPELKVSILNENEAATSPAPELKPQSSGAGWIEKYTVVKDPNGNQYHYYRYCWREKGKIRHYHISGGSAKSPLVLERVERIKDAIAQGKTHFNIENWIKGGFGKSGYNL